MRYLDNVAPLSPSSFCFRCNELVEACDADAEAGYTDDYTPGLGLIVTEQYETSMLEGPDVDYINSTTSTECSLFYGGFTNRDCVQSLELLPHAPAVATTRRLVE